MSPRSQQGKGGSGDKGAGCLIWIALFLLIALLFLLNRGKIEETLKNTKFTDLLKTRLVSPSPGAGRAPSPRGVQASPGRGTPAKSPSPAASAGIEPEDSPRASAAPRKSPSPAASAKPPSPAPSAKPSPAASQAPKRRNAVLYFVHIDGDGVFVLQEGKRLIPSSDSPLTDSLNALLAGPTLDELNRGISSLIPKGTKLLSVVMRGTTAVVNFNEAFMFNSVGIDGYAAQLKQVVWTATDFSTVQDVQFIIEGQKIDYLGGDNVFIGIPLSRNSF
jgi:germination protein M